jgi:hypothetical protein
LILTPDTGLREKIEAGAEKRAQEIRIEWIKDAAHLVMAGNVTFKPVDIAEVDFFRGGLSFEIEEGRGLD